MSAKKDPVKPANNSRGNIIETKDVLLSDITVYYDQNARSLPKDGKYLGVDDLAKSMQAMGQETAIVVEVEGDKYRLVTGHRRFQAAQALGWTTLRADIKPSSNQVERMLSVLSENESGDRPDAFSTSMFLIKLQDLAGKKKDSTRWVLGEEAIATKTGMSAAYAGNLLRLGRKLHPAILDAWRDGLGKASNYNNLLSYVGLDHAQQWEKWLKDNNVTPEEDKTASSNEENKESKPNTDKKKRLSPKNIDALIDILTSPELKKATKGNPDAELQRKTAYNVLKLVKGDFSKLSITGTGNGTGDLFPALTIAGYEPPKDE